jgi:hypothetical protein
MNIDEAFNIETIQLEPRLQEYLRKKKFNEENDIEPSISVEQQFCITPFDLKMIKRHKQGKTKTYTSKRMSKNPHFVKANTDSFESDIDFKNDPRYQRLQRKMQSHKDARTRMNNLSGINEEYTIFHESNPYDMNPEKIPRKIAKPFESSDNDDLSVDENDCSLMMDSRDLVLAPSRMGKKNDARGQYCYNPNNKAKNPNSYHHTPKIAYKQIVTPYQVNGGLKHSRYVKDVIGNLDTYNKHLSNTYDYIQSDADLDTKTFTPGHRSNSRREMQSGYQAVPYQYGNGLPDVSLEDSLRGTDRDSKKKSIGFRNPFEHQFDYISSDISSADHSVQMWPENTRGDNKEMARPDSSAVRSERRIRDAELANRYNMSDTQKRRYINSR